MLGVLVAVVVLRSYLRVLVAFVMLVILVALVLSIVLSSLGSLQLVT